MKNKLDDDRNDAVPGFHHHYLLQQRQQEVKTRDCLSDEVDSVRISSEEIEKAKPDVEHNDKKALVLTSSGGGGGGGDGATVEVAKKRRGRPLGSKNKPKPPVVITREAEPTAAMRPHVLEIPAGHDVAASLARFALRRNLGICVLGGSGAVANVALRQPHFGGAAAAAVGAGASICFHGRLEILSISATFLPPAMSTLSPAIGGEVSISLSGPQGQVVGGTLTGPLVAAGTVVIVAAAFSNPTFHRLPVEDDVSVSVSLSGGGGDGGEAREHEQQHVHQQAQAEHRHRRHQVLTTTTAPLPAADSCGMTIYGGHLSPDVIWAPVVRPPPPPPY